MRRRFNKQFKLTAVKSIKGEQLSVAEISKVLDIHYNSLYVGFGSMNEYDIFLF